jgi:hypothetical protein
MDVETGHALSLQAFFTGNLLKNKSLRSIGYRDKDAFLVALEITC